MSEDFILQNQCFYRYHCHIFSVRDTWAK